MASQLRSTWEASISVRLERRLDRVAGGHRSLLSENVRMAADQLAIEACDHIRDGEVARLARHLGIEEHLQQEIAQFLAKVGPIPPLDGVEDLIALLEGIFPYGVEALLAIPGAAIGTAQPGHDAHCFGEKRSRISGRGSLRTHVNNVNDGLEDSAPTVTVVFTHDCLVIFFGLFGLLLGSFLNVCIVRLPAGESVVWPRSHCRQCDQPIANWDNIPVLSWLLLGGACRKCGGRISWRYPLIELAICILFLMCCLHFSFGWLAGCWALLCFLLLGLAVMDAETLLLPDWFTLPGLVAGIVFAGLRPGLESGVWTWAAVRTCGRAVSAGRGGRGGGAAADRWSLLAGPAADGDGDGRREAPGHAGGMARSAANRPGAVSRGGRGSALRGGNDPVPSPGGTRTINCPQGNCRFPSVPCSAWLESTASF